MPSYYAGFGADTIGVDSGLFIAEKEKPRTYYRSEELITGQPRRIEDFTNLTGYFHDTGFKDWTLEHISSSPSDAAAWAAINDPNALITSYRPKSGSMHRNGRAYLGYYYDFKPDQVFPGLKNYFESAQKIRCASGYASVGNTDIELFKKVNFISPADYFNSFELAKTPLEYIEYLMAFPCAGISLEENSPLGLYRNNAFPDWAFEATDDKVRYTETDFGFSSYDTTKYLGYIGRNDVYSLPDGRSIRQAYDDAIRNFGLVCHSYAYSIANDAMLSSQQWDTNSIRGISAWDALTVMGIDEFENPTLPKLYQYLANYSMKARVDFPSKRLWDVYNSEISVSTLLEYQPSIFATLRLPSSYTIDGTDIVTKLTQLYKSAMIIVNSSLAKAFAQLAKTENVDYVPTVEEKKAIQDITKNLFLIPNVNTGMFEHLEQNLISIYPSIALSIRIPEDQLKYYKEGLKLYAEYSYKPPKPPPLVEEGSIIPMVIAAAVGAVLIARSQ